MKTHDRVLLAVQMAELSNFGGAWEGLLFVSPAIVRGTSRTTLRNAVRYLLKRRRIYKDRRGRYRTRRTAA